MRQITDADMIQAMNEMGPPTPPTLMTCKVFDSKNGTLLHTIRDVKASRMEGTHLVVATLENRGLFFDGRRRDFILAPQDDTQAS